MSMYCSLQKNKYYNSPGNNNSNIFTRGVKTMTKKIKATSMIKLADLKYL